jgi:putative tricarboxylic transport membrane protein
MRRYDLISGTFWLVVGVFIVAVARTYSFGTFREPGGGLYPTLVGLLLIGMSCLLIAKNWRAPTKEEAISWGPDKKGLKRCLLTLVALLLMPFLFDLLGFFPTMLFFVFFVAKIVLSLGWSAAVATSVCCTAGGYLVFQLWLKIPFPQGFFGG